MFQTIPNREPVRHILAYPDSAICLFQFIIIIIMFCVYIRPIFQEIHIAYQFLVGDEEYINDSSLKD